MASFFKKSWFTYTALDNTADIENKAYSDDSTEDLAMVPKRRDRGSSFGCGIQTFIVLLGGIAIGLIIAFGAKTTVAYAASKNLPAPSRNGYFVTKIVDGQVVEGTQCGATWQEAKAMGCIYDIIASRWYAPECFDKESFDAMLSEPGTNWTWYSDKEHTVQVPTEMAEKGEFELLFPLHDFHKIHCLYLWRKMHHSLLNNLPLDDDLMAEDHTIHCTKNLLTWPDPDVHELASIAHAGRPFCRRNPLGVMPLELV